MNGCKKKQLTLQDALKPKYNRQSKKWQQLTDSVTFCLAKDMMPIYSIEKDGFRKLLYNFDPQYELPSRKYFSKTAIPILYSETQDKVAAEIKDVEFFSATADMWRSNTTEPYLSYTIHFVGNDWTLDTCCLQVLYLPKDHNGQNIAEALEGALDSWNLDASRQVCIKTDNGSNIVCATTTHLGWTRLSCFGHNLNLAIENSIKNDDRVSRALGVCRKLVSTFSHSFKLQQNLSKAQKELDLPCHNLVTDCQTRWGSMQK